MNKWECIIDYCNLYQGQIGSRQGMIDHVIRAQSLNVDIANRRGFTTIDCYKNYLVQAGFIHKLKVDGRVKQGKFFIPKEIPIGISIQEVRDKAYGPKLMIMGADQADPLGQRSAYVGDGKWMIQDDTANQLRSRPKEIPEFINEKEMKL